MRAGPSARPVERWVVGECIVEMLRASRNKAVARGADPDLFINECHCSSVVTISVGNEPTVTQSLVLEIQRILRHAQSISEVNLEFDEGTVFPSARERLRGLEITADRVQAYKGSTLPKASNPIDSLPQASQTLAATLRDMATRCIEKAEQSEALFTDADVWNMLAPGVRDAFTRHGMREKAHYELAPYVDEVRVIAVSVKKASQITDSVIESLKTVMLGKNPWELLIGDERRDNELIVTVVDGDAYRGE